MAYLLLCFFQHLLIFTSAMLKLNFENNILPSKGKLLLSEPFMTENYFSRAVVLLAEHGDENGTFGFVLNKPVNVKISEVIRDFPDFEAHVYLGGPVNKDNIFYIHTLGNILPDSRHIIDNIYWGGDFEVLKKLVRSNKIHPHEIKFIAGYAGWTEGQLDEELKDKHWIVSHYFESIDIINFQAYDMWSKILKDMGGEYSMMSNFPLNPQSN